MFHNLLNSPCFLPPDVSIWSHQHFAVEVGVCIFITRLLCLHLYPLSIHRVHWWQRLMKWEDLGMFLCAHFTVHLTHLLEVRLRFSVSDGKGCSYSQVVYSSTTLPMNAYPSQQARLNSPWLSVCLLPCKFREPVNGFWQGVTCWFQSGCDLRCTLPSFVAVFPKRFATGPLINPHLGKAVVGEMRWFCRLCVSQGADRRTEDDSGK